MATPNYGYEKRQKELAKKRKKEDKLRSKTAVKPGDAGSDGGQETGTPADGGSTYPPVTPTTTR